VEYDENIVLKNKIDSIQSKLIKLPSQKSELEELNKKLSENKKIYDELIEQRKSVLEASEKSRAELKELKATFPGIGTRDMLVREFMNKTKSEALRQIPGYQNADKIASLVDQDSLIAKEIPGHVRRIISENFDEQLDEAVEEIDPSLPKSAVSNIFGQEALNYRRSRVNSNDTFTLNLIRNNPEARALFGNDELIEREYQATKNSLTDAILNDDYSSKSEVNKAHLALLSLKDRELIKIKLLTYLDPEISERNMTNFKRDFWSRISQEDRDELFSLYGQEEINFCMEYSININPTREETERYKSLLNNFKTKLKESRMSRE
jgi:hypothetical protein